METERDSDLENELMVARVRMGEGIAREFRVDMHTLLDLKWITSKDVLYSTWHSAQCYVAAWMGGVWGRIDKCIYMAESVHCSPETAHC